MSFNKKVFSKRRKENGHPHKKNSNMSKINESFLKRIGKMVILLLGKEIDRDVTSVEQRKNSEALVKNRTSDLRIPRSGALLLSHRDSVVSEVKI